MGRVEVMERTSDCWRRVAPEWLTPKKTHMNPCKSTSFPLKHFTHRTTLSAYVMDANDFPKSLILKHEALYFFTVVKKLV